MRILLYIAFIFSIAQVWAQRPYVELIVTPNVVELNQPFNVTVKSNIQGENINIDLPEAWVDGRSVMNRMESEIDMNTNELVTFLYYSKSGTMTKSGKFTFGPAYVRKGNKVYRSNKVTVEVKEYVAPKDEEINVQLVRKPAAGQILCNKKECYEGEAVCLQAQVLSKFNPTHYESYDSYSCEPITEEHEFDKTRQVTVRLKNFGRHERFVFELDKKVIFPQKAGKLVVQPFEMMLQSGFDSYPILSSRAIVVVKKLPDNAPKSFCGVVGKIKLNDGCSAMKCMKGDVVTYEVAIEGCGNLQDVQQPKLQLPEGFTIYGDPEVREKYAYGEEGAKGTISWKYFLKCAKVGEFESPKIEMAYFDPVQGKYQVLRNKPSKWIVLESPVLDEDQKSSSEVLVMEKYGEKEDEKNQSKVGEVLKWVGYSTPFCLAFLFLLFRVKKKSEPKETKEEETKEEEQPQVTTQPLNELKQVLPSLCNQDFLYRAIHCIDDMLSLKIKGETGWSLSQEELNDACLQGLLTEEQIFGVKYLKTLSDNCRYGGLQLDLSKEEILQKVENLKIQV